MSILLRTQNLRTPPDMFRLRSTRQLSLSSIFHLENKDVKGFGRFLRRSANNGEKSNPNLNKANPPPPPPPPKGSSNNKRTTSENPFSNIEPNYMIGLAIGIYFTYSFLSKLNPSGQEVD